MFHHETRGERNFDLALIAAIVASVLVVLLDSDPAIKARWARAAVCRRVGLHLLFAVEYAARLWTVCRTAAPRAAFGIVDLAIVPTFLSLFPASTSLTVVRQSRTMRRRGLAWRRADNKRIVRMEQVRIRWSIRIS